MSNAEERPQWPIKSPKKGCEKKAEDQEEREIRLSLLILDLKEGKLQHSGKEEESKAFHKLHVLRMNDDLWHKVHAEIS